MIYNVTEYLERNARLVPDKIAVSDRSGSYTWLELRTRARRIATSLLSEGMERGIMVYGDTIYLNYAFLYNVTVSSDTSHSMLINVSNCSHL